MSILPLNMMDSLAGSLSGLSSASGLGKVAGQLNGQFAGPLSGQGSAIGQNPDINTLDSEAQSLGLAGATSPGQVLQGFGDLLSQQLQTVSQLQQSTDQQVQAYAGGADIPLHQIMIGMEKSGTAMDLAIQVRNKLVGAYQELSRMQF
jgi:flagellar hook-basal body complex protein FliE